jgi:hypothetical protein
MTARDRLVEFACRRAEHARAYTHPVVRELVRVNQPTRADRLARELKDRRG